MLFYCNFCKLNKNFSNVKQISAHLSFCKQQQEKLHTFKQTLHTNQIKLNSDNLLDNNYAFSQDDKDCSNESEVDETLYNRAKQHDTIDKETLFGISNAEYHSSILLLDILQKAGCPLNCFDEIVDWAKKSNEMGVKFDEMFKPTRTKTLRDIESLFDLHDLTPMVEPYKMLSSKEVVPVVHIDFLIALYSLLNDKELMVSKNLLNDDLVDDDVLDDINSGSVYQEAKKIYVKDPNRDKMIPIILFMDKTHTDINGRLKLEPVMFTLGIFKRECRADPSFWRILGFVTDTTDAKKADPKVKLQDYHNILDIILKSYYNAQHKPIKWGFIENDDITKDYQCWFPCLYVIGDTEGHDKGCGRFNCRTNVKRLCRYCDIKFERTDDPFAKYKFTLKKDVQRHIDNKNLYTLKQMSMHCIQNAFSRVKFCDDIRGLHGATLAEVLHVLQQGLDEYILEAFLGNKKGSKDLKKQNTAEIINENAEYIAPSEEFLSIQNVFGPTYTEHFEKACKKIGAILQHQSNRNLPRTKFFSQYTSITKKNGHEMAGLFIVYILTMCSVEGEKLETLLGSERLSAFIHVFELVLMLENFAQSPCHIKQHLKEVFEKGIPFIMKTMKDVINRTDGNGMKIIKFHLLVHFVSDILRYGSMLNFNSAIGEMMHKTEIKTPAQHTQRNKDSFEIQTCHRNFECTKIRRAANNTKSLLKQNFENFIANEKKESSPYQNNNIEFDSDNNCFVKNKGKQNNICTWKDETFESQLKSLCKSMIDNGYVSNSTIKFFTIFKKNDVLYRADPCYYSDSEPWYDWAYVNWGKGCGNIATKLLIFIDLEDNFVKPFKIGITEILAPGKYAITYSTMTNEQTEAHGISCLVQYDTLECDNRDKPILSACNIDKQIQKPCVAVPYNTDENCITAKQWMFLIPRNEWYTVLCDHLENHLIQEEQLDPYPNKRKRSTERNKILKKYKKNNS